MSVSIPRSFADVVQGPDVAVHLLEDDGTYPNNEVLPLLVYRHALRSSVDSLVRTFEQVFRAHNWRGSWRNGIFPYHHYHSTAHEVLGVAGGRATVQLGGPGGVTLDVTAGDVLVLPAGMAHKNRGASEDFLVVGAYPEGRRWDLNRGEPGDRPEADRNIEQVPLPSLDPVYGEDGPLHEHWKQAD
jgi:uncharacterized protein YjlB